MDIIVCRPTCVYQLRTGITCPHSTAAETQAQVYCFGRLGQWVKVMYVQVVLFNRLHEGYLTHTRTLKSMESQGISESSASHGSHLWYQLDKKNVSARSLWIT